MCIIRSYEKNVHLIIRFSKFLVTKHFSLFGLCLAYPHTLGTNLEEVDGPRFTKRNRHTPWEGPFDIIYRLNYYTAQEFSSTGTELPVLH